MQMRTDGLKGAPVIGQAATPDGVTESGRHSAPFRFAGGEYSRIKLPDLVVHSTANFSGVAVSEYQGFIRR